MASKKYGQMIYNKMSTYGENLETIIDSGKLYDLSLYFDEKIQILDEGLDLMVDVLQDIHTSESVHSLPKEDKKELLDITFQIREMKENIHNDEYYDEEFEMNSDIELIHQFYQNGKKLYIK